MSEIVFKKESNSMQDGILWHSQGLHISLNPVQRYVSPLFFLLLLKEISSTSSNTTVNTTRFKTGIKQLQRWNIMVLAGGINRSLNRCRDMRIPSLFFYFSSYPLLNEILSVVLI